MPRPQVDQPTHWSLHLAGVAKPGDACTSHKAHIAVRIIAARQARRPADVRQLAHTAKPVNERVFHRTAHRLLCAEPLRPVDVEPLPTIRTHFIQDAGVSRVLVEHELGRQFERIACQTQESPFEPGTYING